MLDVSGGFVEKAGFDFSDFNPSKIFSFDQSFLRIGREDSFENCLP